MQNIKLFLSHGRCQIIIIHVKIIEIFLRRHFLSKNVILVHSESAIKLLDHATHRKLFPRFSICRNDYELSKLFFDSNLETKSGKSSEKPRYLQFFKKWEETKSRMICGKGMILTCPKMHGIKG